MVETTYIVMKPLLHGFSGGTSNQYTVDWPEQPSRKQLEEVITPHLDPRAGKLEHVFCLSLEGTPVSMFVGELSAMTGLPINLAATRTYQNNAIKNRGAKAAELPMVYGPAVVFNRRVWF